MSLLNLVVFQEKFLKMSSERRLHRLSKNEILRYSRQLVLPEIGIDGQVKLKNASVLVVGAGGLGCPVSIYLASAGVGRIGVVDYDTIEVTNLHRQISHTENGIGSFKTQSLVNAIKELNSRVICIPYECQLSSDNALQIIKQFEIVVDCTDNVATRYLLNDACVLTNRPLISGSALRFEGQLTVYNYKGGPCYRCLFPVPPPPEGVTNCSDGGVIGAVPGVIGCLQSLEVIKMIVGLEVSYNKKLFIFDGLAGLTKVVNLRPRQTNCNICGINPTITQLIDYEQFCGAPAMDKEKKLDILSVMERISCEDYYNKYSNSTDHLLIDVRPRVEIDICKLPRSINIPIGDLTKIEYISHLQNLIEESLRNSERRPYPVFVVCRKGNDSQAAVDKLKPYLKDFPILLRDLKGGLREWSETIDDTFPVY